MVLRKAYVVMGICLLISSCTQATVQTTPTLLQTGVLTPYHTVTPSPIRPTATIKVTIPVTPLPTATPFLYTVKGNDTMLSIAYQYGVSLEDLQAANPMVDPHYMGEGLKLIIPISGEIPEDLSTPTPMPVHSEPPMCYRAGDGGAWCIVTLRNDLEASLENLSAWIGLYNTQGEIIASQVVYALLNILRPGNSIPLMAYFAAPIPNDFIAQSEVLSGLAVGVDDSRYIDLQVKVGTVAINPDRSEAMVSGDVLKPDGTPTLAQLWTLAVAYDSNGNIVGARKWKSAGDPHFEITVYSLAGKIDHVEVLIEARP